MSWYRKEDSALVLTLRIQPGASRNDFAGLHGDALKVRIHSPPTDGLANRELLDFLADAFGTAKANVSLLRGESSRMKTVRIRAHTRIPPAIAAFGPELVSAE